jgi:hypothetical protein
VFKRRKRTFLFTPKGRPKKIRGAKVDPAQSEEVKLTSVFRRAAEDKHGKAKSYQSSAQWPRIPERGEDGVHSIHFVFSIFFRTLALLDKFPYLK